MFLNNAFSFDSSYEDELFLQSMQSLQIASEMVLWDIASNSSSNASSSNSTPKRRKGRSGVVYYITEEGETKVLPTTLSTWYLIYIKHPALDNAFHKKFRRRFHLPYDEFLKLVDDIKSVEHFQRWQNTDALGKNSHPLELLVLTALRYLGRGWTFNDLSKSTGISEEVIHVFFILLLTTEAQFYTVLMWLLLLMFLKQRHQVQ
jgi:hypothetical protein